MAKIRKEAPQKIDAYIEKAAPFAAEIAHALRQLIHEADERIIEDWKWGPNFYCEGMVCGFGLFKKHVTFTFFKGALMEDKEQLFNYGGDNQSNRSIKFEKVAEVEAAADAIKAYVQEAIVLNEKGVTLPPEHKEVDIPERLEHFFDENPTLQKVFDQLSFTERKEHAQWIAGAKKGETVARRLKKLEAILSGQK